MNAPVSPATLYPIWEAHQTGPYTCFTIRLNENASYGGLQEGSTYYVALPGQGLRRCWNRREVERVCRDHYEQLQAMDDDPDDEDAGSVWDREASTADRLYQERMEGIR
jgi:hypothetical protein